jgi:large subunit ribosomal protein L28
VPEFKRFVTLKLTTRDLRTIDKLGLLAFARQHGVTL